MDKHAIFENFSFYREASPKTQKAMATVGQYTSVPAGTFLYHEGDRTEQFALVGTGSIRVFKTESAGHEITLYHVRDGQACLVNMLSVFLERPAMATAVVEVEAEAVVIPASAFRDWLDAEQTMRKFVFESMATRLIDVMVLAEELAFRRMDQRLGQWLLDRFSGQQKPRKVIATTHEEIAKELGSVREVVSRLLKVLERSKAITTSRGRITLLNEVLLRKMTR